MQTLKTLAEFAEGLHGRSMRGTWESEPFLNASIGGPQPAGVPFIWRWSEVHAALQEASVLMPESQTARRNINFSNPGLEPRHGTSHTIVAGLQLVLPGETAWAHRHTLGAIRFGVEGSEKLYTVVDGEPLPMFPNDLVLTPNWTWHDHHNDSDRVGIWLDVLDAPLVAGALNQTFYEPLGELTQALRTQRGDYVSERGKMLRPVGERRPVRNFPYRYAWSEAEPLLRAYAAAGKLDPHDGVLLEYVNPITGGPTLPTLTCYLQLLPKGFVGAPHRHTASTVYFVAKGSGSSLIGDTEIAWSDRDTFVVPNWMRHQHQVTSDEAILFVVSDEPVLEMLGLSYAEPRRELAPLPPVPAGR
jgi:gentisate 1,2-dioxygenase